jgi:hypothetical protein
MHTAAGTQTLYMVEKTFGDGGSGTTQWFGLVQEHVPDENENREPIRYSGGADRNVDIFLDGATNYRNSIPFLMQTGKFIGAAFGKVASDSGTKWTHTITESGTLPSFMVEEALESVTNEHIIRTHSGCTVDVLEISGEEGGPIMCSVDYIAQGSAQTSGTKTVVNAATDKPYMWSMVKLEGSGSSFDGSFNELKTFTFRLSNGLDPDNYMDNTRSIAQPTPLERDYEFNMDMNTAHGTGGEIYDALYRAGSEINFDLWIFRTSGTDHFQIWMSGCKTLDCDLPQPHIGKVEMTWVTQPTKCGVFVKHGEAAYPFSTV